MRSIPVSIQLPAGLLTAAILGFLPGCYDSPDIDAGQEFSQGVQKNDIPIPNSFVFDKDHPQSYDYKLYETGVGKFRHWRGTYYGDQQVSNLVPWFEKNMVVDGWSHSSTETKGNSKFLVFTKGEETARIQILRDWDERQNKNSTFIKAAIDPTEIVEMPYEQLLGYGVRDDGKPASGAAASTIPARILPASSRGSPPGGDGAEPSRSTRRMPPEARPAAGGPDIIQREPVSVEGARAVPSGASEAATGIESLGNKGVVKQAEAGENSDEAPVEDGDGAVPDDSE